MAWIILKVPLMLEGVVLAHLLGHLLLARIVRMPMEIHLGLGPAIPGCRFRRGQWTWVLAFCPLGGYVKPVIAEPATGKTKEDNPMAFPPAWKHLLVLPGGILMNLFLAWICFTWWVSRGAEEAAAVIGAVDSGSPAWKKGLSTGAAIERIGDIENPTFSDLMGQVTGTLKDQKLKVRGSKTRGRKYLAQTYSSE